MATTTTASSGPEAERPPPELTSGLRHVLEEANDDLLYAEYPKFIGWFFNPVRDQVLSPALGVATDIIPAVSEKIPVPFTDEMSALALGFTFGAFKLGYRMLSHQDLDEEANEETKGGALKTMEIVQQKERKKNEEESEGLVGHVLDLIPSPREVGSTVLSMWGFAANTLLDIATSPGEKLSDWSITVREFIGFLLFSGIDKELHEAFVHPRAKHNMLITGRIQANGDLSGCIIHRGRKTSIEPPLLTRDDLKANLKDAARYMRYATAAYGIEMMESAEELLVMIPGSDRWGVLKGIEHVMINVHSVLTNSEENARKRKIAKYVNIKEEDILYITARGGDSKLLRHFVAVDHKAKAVVLSIRGTFTVSGLLADIEANTSPFCGGYAHTGIAERAEYLMSNTETTDAIANALREHPDYELILTGHSLGAGCACLVNIKMLYDGVLPWKNVRCFGFASPPVYVGPTDTDWNTDVVLKTKIEHAIKRCTCYIHESDCVPFLSADSVRRLADTLSDVDEVASQMNPVERFLTARGLKDPPDGLEPVVERDSSDLLPRPGAHRLEIPASFVLWMHKVSDDDAEGGRDSFDFASCDPTMVSNLSILLSYDMILDHMPPNYEKAICSVLESEIKRNDID